MGWLDGIIGKRSEDPLQDLDPRIKQFLEKESPHKLADPKTRPKATEEKQTTTPPAHTAPDATSGPRVPPQSLFQDGRYAHLWKTYTPLHEIEAATKSDHEKLRDVVDAFKDRKAQIGRAALENCVIQQEEWHECLRSGSWKDTLQLCRHQVRAFEKCYVTQARLLKALGYYSAYGRTPEIEEDIQMHADSLYTRILAHEALAREAAAAGRPAPEFDPRVHIREGQERVARMRKDAAVPDMEPNERVAAEWRKQLDQLPEADRPVEEAALRADFQARAKLAKEVEKLWGDHEKQKHEAKKKADAEGPKPDKMVWQQLLEKLKGQ